ncbi:MFS transporter [Alkalicoccobacillus murimartini]|uniref:MFS family permease n=1 Tax=Alkalicoccobacillus murimartini TaxID=171685 RepID=A0ABT9YFL0_9BACI|nr:MFS transporter [Alkalicoccobacillus murimartini]MDQ0206635.1 MFS family permease [Alkalicoccobacillus murimartini]
MKDILMMLKEERSFKNLMIARFVGGIGDWFSSIAILTLLLQLTGTGLAVGITLAARTLPMLIMGPIGGILADKFNKKKILFTVDIVRGFIILSFLFVNTTNDLWIVYTTTVALVVFSALAIPARASMIPVIVSDKNIAMANSLEQVISGTVMTLGAALGGIVAALFGSNVSFIINSCTFLISAIFISRIVFSSKKAEENSINDYEKEELIRFRDVFKESKFIRIIFLQAILWPIGGGAINVLISIYGFEVLDGGNVGVGILYSALGAGFLISGLIAHKLSRKLKLAVIMAGIIEGGCHILFSLSPTIFIASFFIIIATIGAGIGNVAVNTLIMKTVPSRVHGRAFAMCDTTSSVIISVSMISTGVLAGLLNPIWIGVAGGIVIMSTSIIALPILKMDLKEQNVSKGESVTTI